MVVMEKNTKNKTQNRKQPRPRVLIFSGYGLNTEDETKAAFESVGASAEIVHLNDAIAHPEMFKEAQIIVFSGGFAYGDHTGAGKAYGNRVREHLGAVLEEFLARNTLMIGICNGFQVVTSAGFLPGALIPNETPRYLCRWVDVEVRGESPWLKGIRTFSVPIAHGEGKYYAPEELLGKIKAEGAVALKYVEGEIAHHFDMMPNPNGSLENIAGVTAYNGRVLGLMPHPERAVRFTQLPHWTHVREQYVREGKKLPTEGPGLQIFRNAVEYFS